MFSATIFKLIWCVIGLTAALEIPLHAQSSSSADAPITAKGSTGAPLGATRRVQAPLERLVSLDLRDVHLDVALQAIDRQADLGLTFTPRVVPVNRRVTIHANSITAGEALVQVLHGTGVHAVVTTTETVLLVKSEAAALSDTTEHEGIIWGGVTDSTTTKPLSGVSVEVQGTRLTTITNARGSFFLTHVPAGVQVVTVRQIGFVPVEREVVVADSQRVYLQLHLQMSMTRLQEVVTTATGQQRRLELGNDITVINADSIVATQPVASVTDLLATRVPGLTVQRTSGAPGDPARLRLRGVGSISLSSDPIVFVDRVRVYSAQSDPRNMNLAHSDYASPSPLDDIDPHSIKTIEVFKGPSAAALYGPDAANGVIVITTKRGEDGPPRWTASAERGITYIPGSYPVNYLRWGHNPVDNTPVLCPLSNPSCIGDSLVTFQALNTPATSPLGQGQNTSGTLGVSGGSNSLTYNVIGHYRQVTGTTHMPAFEMVRYETVQGVTAPSWMQHPDDLTDWGGSMGLGAQVGSNATVSVTTMLTRTRQQRSNLDGQLSGLMRTYLDRATGTYYTSSEGNLLPDQALYGAYNTRLSDQASNWTSALSLDWHPSSWLTTSANAGLNLIQRQDDSFQPSGTGLGSADTTGAMATASGTSLMNTLNVGMTASNRSLPLGISMDISVGVNYSSAITHDQTVNGTGLPQGATSVAQAKLISGGQNSSDVRSFGMYVSPQLHRGGLWLDTGLRFDGGSSYGARVRYAAFPKVSLSYLVSNEAWFPHRLRSLFDDLRMRFAYGRAGRVPLPTDRLRLYQLSSIPLDGSAVDIATMQTLGNTTLRPERTSEFEGGFDADLFGGRLSLSFTGYRKTTRDAILSVPIAPSVYGDGSSVMRNIGVIRNTGFETSLGIDLIRGAPVRWREQVSVSHDNNVLVSLNQGEAPLLSGLLLKPGYPLTGVWAYPLLGYSDRNGDGVIQSSEVLLGNTLVYRGSSMPAYQVNLQSTLGLLGNLITVDFGVSYEANFTQNSFGDLSVGLWRGFNDPTTPLSQQALASSFLVGTGPYPDGSGPYLNYETVSVLRLNSMAITWHVPATASRWLGSQALSVSVQGTNLWLHTNYRGKDPNVNTANSGSFSLRDPGVLPQPRNWQLRVSAAY